jgi:hypothetical protein
MPLHLVKLCVGCESIADLRQWQKRRLERSVKEYGKRALYHFTRNRPKRAEEIVAGGSIYWVIRGLISVRQRIVGIEEMADDEERPLCGLRLGARLVPTELRPMRAFQGWRYMDADAAPPDRKKAVAGAMPPKMVAELRALGLL